MGLITIEILARSNRPPSSSGWLALSLGFNSTYTFTLQNFTTETTPSYVDPEGDALESIKIQSLPSKGVLKLSGSTISSAPQIVTSSQLVSGNLTYESDAADLQGYTDNYMYFSVSDVGSSQFTLKSNPVAFQVLGNENSPPYSVGNNEIDVFVGSTTIITTSMLTTGLNPPYLDSEGDSPSMLLIESLPKYGILTLNNLPVFVSQEISFVDISSNLFKYVNNSLENNEVFEEFNFKISDAGSGEYRG
jgi:hypothetical protein